MKHWVHSLNNFVFFCAQKKSPGDFPRDFPRDFSRGLLPGIPPLICAESSIWKENKEQRGLEGCEVLKCEQVGSVNELALWTDWIISQKAQRFLLLLISLPSAHDVFTQLGTFTQYGALFSYFSRIYAPSNLVPPVPIHPPISPIADHCILHAHIVFFVVFFVFFFLLIRAGLAGLKKSLFLDSEQGGRGVRTREVGR